MNGLEQSDLAIVPMRAANKGTSVPAEPTEGRAGTKGNPRGQSTHRTQRRARVTQAAERNLSTILRHRDGFYLLSSLLLLWKSAGGLIQTASGSGIGLSGSHRTKRSG